MGRNTKGTVIIIMRLLKPNKDLISGPQTPIMHRKTISYLMSIKRTYASPFDGINPKILLSIPSRGNAKNETSGTALNM